MPDGTPVAPEVPSTAPADTGSSGLSLSDDWQSVLGDEWTASGSDTSAELPEPQTPDPARDGAPPEGAAPGAVAAANAEHPETPPVDAAKPAPGANTAAPTTDDDLLKDAKPFTYVVEGQPRTVEGIQTVGDAGAIIDADFLPTLQQRLAEHEVLTARDRDNTERLASLQSQFEAATRWNAGKDAQGNDRILTGLDGAEMQRTLLSRSTAALNTVTSALLDPARFASLVAIQMDDQGNPYVSLDQGALQSLLTAAELDALKAERQVNQHFAQIRSSVRGTQSLQAPTPKPPAESTAPDFSPEMAMTTVKQAIQDLGLKGLTPDDETFLAQQLPRYIRDTTPQERAQFGPRIVDGSFRAVLEREAAKRGELSKTATTATKAAQENASRLAQAALGNPARRPAAPATPAPQQPRPNRAQDADEAFDRLERASVKILQGSRRAG